MILSISAYCLSGTPGQNGTCPGVSRDGTGRGSMTRPGVPAVDPSESALEVGNQLAQFGERGVSLDAVRPVADDPDVGRHVAQIRHNPIYGRAVLATERRRPSERKRNPQNRADVRDGYVGCGYGEQDASSNSPVFGIAKEVTRRIFAPNLEIARNLTGRAVRVFSSVGGLSASVFRPDVISPLRLWKFLPGRVCRSVLRGRLFWIASTIRGLSDALLLAAEGFVLWVHDLCLAQTDRRDNAGRDRFAGMQA